MKTYKFLICFLSVISLVGCKPTEKGYKAAYDAALGKRQAATESLDLGLPEGALMQVDGPQLKEIDGVNVYLQSDRIKPCDETQSLPGNYNVAVGSYKMITNCDSQCKDLRGEGYEAFPASDSEGNYYSIIFSTDSLQEAVKCYEQYQKRTDKSFIGLPNAPVIIYSPK